MTSDRCSALPTELSSQLVIQSLNFPSFPPHIGAEPGRAKRESRITCMRMLRTNQSKIQPLTQTIRVSNKSHVRGKLYYYRHFTTNAILPRREKPLLPGKIKLIQLGKSRILIWVLSVIIRINFNPGLALTGFRTILSCFQEVNLTWARDPIEKAALGQRPTSKTHDLNELYT